MADDKEPLVENADEIARSMTAQYEASKLFQDRIKAKFPTRDKAIAAFGKRGWSNRKDALEALAYLGHDEDVLKYALMETDAPAITSLAAQVLIPAPFELLHHMLTMKNGQLGMVLCYEVPQYNFLHVETEIVDFLKPRKSQLGADKIAACGNAYLRGSAALFQRHLEIDRLRSYDQAMREGRPVKDKPIMFGPTSDATRYWDGASERAIETLVALRRLDQEIDVGFVSELRNQIRQTIPTGDDAWEKLTWVLFDAGREDCGDELLQRDYLFHVRADVATTLLKRQDFQRFDAFAARYYRDGRSGIACNAFCQWPVLDALQARGFESSTLMRRGPEGYYLSRDAGASPPPWWTWQATWERSFFSKRRRGML